MEGDEAFIEDRTENARKQLSNEANFEDSESQLDSSIRRSVKKDVIYQESCEYECHLHWIKWFLILYLNDLLK